MTTKLTDNTPTSTQAHGQTTNSAALTEQRPAPWAFQLKSKAADDEGPILGAVVSATPQHGNHYA